jgi:hypothetical protein
LETLFLFLNAPICIEDIINLTTRSTGTSDIEMQSQTQNQDQNSHTTLPLLPTATQSTTALLNNNIEAEDPQAIRVLEIIVRNVRP